MTKETAAGSSPDNGCLEFTPSSSSCSSRNSSWKLCGRDAIPIGTRSLAADCLDAALNFDEAMKKCYQHCPVWGEQLDNVLGHVYEQRCGVEMVGHVMYAGGGTGRYGSDGSHRIPRASTCAQLPSGWLSTRGEKGTSSNVQLSVIRDSTFNLKASHLGS